MEAVDLRSHRLTVDTGGGVVELGWDRNTLIYQPGGATTAGALRRGAVVKAGFVADDLHRQVGADAFEQFVEAHFDGLGEQEALIGKFLENLA